MATSGEHLALHVAQVAPIAQIPLTDIRVLNPRSRNQQVFARLVENIASLGLKRPITVTRNGSSFDLICGQGRFEAFKVLGESVIPAVVVTAAEADRYLISLVENLARRKHSNRDLLMAINVLHERGYSIRQIAQKTCLDRAYVGGILILLRQGEERLIAAVEKGWLPIKVAIHVARSDDAQVQAVMVETYESGLLKGDELIKVRRLIDRRRVLGKDYGKHQGGERMTTPRQLLTAYQTEVRRQRLMVKKADISEQRLLFVVTALRRLLADDFFCSILRSEGIDDMPQVLAERIRGDA
ncbi:ParB/RepB/Spo0J family partition protein [Pseudomonas sp. NPDC089554]|uniref:ParB/RepB/Spo0J family partition protein n=1 Tax=Pseudomonas sp. NPDC089554 TaxID=3390653 RepID=UPI003D0828CF